MKYCNYTPSLIKTRQLWYEQYWATSQRGPHICRAPYPRLHNYTITILLFCVSSVSEICIVCREREMDYKRLLIWPTYSADELQQLSISNAVSSGRHPTQLASSCYSSRLSVMITSETATIMGNPTDGWICPQNLKCDSSHISAFSTICL